MTARVYFFGTIDVPGHYWWPRKRRGKPEGVPWEYVDGRLQPKDDLSQGAAALHHKDGWTALGFWDYTVDARPSSNGAFFIDQTLDFDETYARFVGAFPDVAARVGGLSTPETEKEPT